MDLVNWVGLISSGVISGKSSAIGAAISSGFFSFITELYPSPTGKRPKTFKSALKSGLGENDMRFS
jgi:hypothetical protein